MGIHQFFSHECTMYFCISVFTEINPLLINLTHLKGKWQQKILLLFETDSKTIYRNLLQNFISALFREIF